MNPIKEIQDKKLNSTLKLTTGEKIKEVKKEVKDYKQKLQDYGIKNKTRKTIENKEQEIRNQKIKQGEKQALNILIKEFAPTSIVTYKTLNQICEDYKLVISSISNYNKAIPDENIEDIDAFFTRLKKIDQKLLKQLKAKQNFKFTFDDEGWKEFISEWNPIISSDEMFKIAAPKTHFKFDENYEKIGNEIAYLNSPKLKWKPKLNTIKSVQLDPIVFLPIKFLNKVFCIIITAWDKEADDSRILSKIK